MVVRHVLGAVVGVLLCALPGCASAADDETGAADQASTTRAPGTEDAVSLEGQIARFKKTVPISPDAELAVFSKMTISDVTSLGRLVRELSCAVRVKEITHAPRTVEPSSYAVSKVYVGQQDRFNLFVEISLDDLDATDQRIGPADFSLFCTGLNRAPLAQELTTNMQGFVEFTKRKVPGGSGAPSGW